MFGRRIRCTSSFGFLALLRRFFWRGRMGVEPTGAGNTDAHTVLKTGEATGPHPPPRGKIESKQAVGRGSKR